MSEKRIGRYELEKTLGRGAMGVVYLARDPIIDRLVALKTLRVDLDADHVDEFRERFVREARAAGRLNHPGIVTVHDVEDNIMSGCQAPPPRLTVGGRVANPKSEIRN